MRYLTKNVSFLLLLFLSQGIIFLAKATDNRFIENVGQWDSEIIYRADIPGGYMMFTDRGFTYVFYEDPTTHAHHHHSHNHDHDNHSGPHLRTLGSPIPQIHYHTVKVNFLNATSPGQIIPDNPGNERYNYFLGNDPDKWATSVKSFQEISYKNIYPGIDIRFYGQDHLIKYDLIVKPKANVENIRFMIDGADKMSISDGQLEIETSLGQIKELAPYTYQKDESGRKRQVLSQFKLVGNILSFDVDNYDKSEELVIDPALVFSTFSGSTADNWGFTATFDEAGNTYSAGIVRPVVGGSIPTTTGAYSQVFQGGVWDVAVFKYDSTGQNLLYGTYLGGIGNEYPHSLVVNNAGELVILGSTGSNNFPVSDDAFDRTFNGGQFASPLVLTNPLISDVVTFQNGSDIFVSKLSNDGSALTASTYLGGSSNDGIGVVGIDNLVKNYGDQFRGDVIIDSHDNVYLASNTKSTDFPISGGFLNTFAGGNRDGIVVKLPSQLTSITWSTYMGGSQEDVAYSIKLVENNNVLISGGTDSNDLPGTSGGINPTALGGIDGFAAIISNDGTTLQSATYIGTVNDDQAYFTDFDEDYNVYLLGQTQGNYPVTSGVVFNVDGGQFIHKLNPDLTSTLFSTKFGAGVKDIFGRVIPDISPTAFLVSECNKFYLSGWGSQSLSTTTFGYQGLNIVGLPLTADAFQQSPNNGAFYMAVFEENAEELVFASYFGGSVASAHVDGGTSRFDKRGIIYQSVCSCGGANDNFPTTTGAWSTTNNSFPEPTPQGLRPRCNNAVFKYDLATLSAGIATNTPDGDSPGIREVCIPSSILFVNASNGGINVTWNLGDGTIVENQDSIVHAYQSEGVYVVSITVEDESTCEQIDVASTTITVREGEFSILNDQAICEGSSIQLTATGADDYLWIPDDPSSPAINQENPTVAPVITTQYELEASTLDGCFWRDSVEVRVIPLVQSDFEIAKQYECMDSPTFQLINRSAPSTLLNWTFGDGNTSQEEDLEYRYTSEGDFTIRLSTQTEFCIDFKTEEVRSELLFLPNVITPNGDDSNEVFLIPTDGNAELSIVNRYGDEVFHTTDYESNWDAEGLPDGVYYYSLTMPDSAATECKGVVHVLR